MARTRPRILVADDDRFILQLIRQTLETLNHDVRLVADGQQALFTADIFKPDLIILDGAMPVLDGFAALEVLRADPAHRARPILMLTALRGEAEVRRAIDGGASGYLTKPFRPDQLIQRVQLLLARPKGAADAVPL